MVYLAQLAITLFAITAASGVIKMSVYLGEPDRDQKYPYVVSFIHGHRRACSGTLIAPNWVLTSGQCTFYSDEHRVQYGNLSYPPSHAKLVSRVIKAVKHPFQYANDDANPDLFKSYLQLVLVETIPIKRYGNVSSVDYKALLGNVVEYASLEVTYQDLEQKPTAVEGDNKRRPLMLGQGMVTTCDSEGMDQDGPLMCVAPTCENKFQPTWSSAHYRGPLFHGGKVIGVFREAGNLPVIRYAAVSPYIDWIHLVITHNNINDGL